MVLEEKDKRGVVTVTLNRPEIHNAFNEEMIQKLTETFKRLSSDDGVRLIVLEGNGKSFCAGADLNWMKKMKDYTKEENNRDSEALAQMFIEINNCTKPVLGKVQGAALGGGTGLLAVCDFVIAEESTKIGFTEARLGLAPAVISPFVIAKIGESNARATFLSGERFEASEAQRIGLVHALSPAKELDKKLSEKIEEFLKAAPRAAAATKNLIRGVLSKGPAGSEKVTAFTCGLISRLRVSDEGQEGMSALLEKRKPKWPESAK